MKQIILFIFLIFGIAGYAQKKMSRAEYISKWQKVAIEEMNRSGIPASITMAQGCLESGNGNSELSRESNNHFGIKCKKSWTGKKVYYDDDRKNECFRSYNTVRESYIDHTDFLMENQRYASLFKLKTTDYKGWAKGLKKAGYATAHDYDKKLIRIIEENKLHRLDKKITIDELATFEQKSLGSNGFSTSVPINSFKSHEVVAFNRTKAVITNEGDTYEMLAQEFGLTDWELFKFNDRREGYRPGVKEVVYLQGKKTRADKSHATHTAQAGETMHDISQMYGVKLKSLYKKNRMRFGAKIEAGQVIYLRSKKKK